MQKTLAILTMLLATSAFCQAQNPAPVPAPPAPQINLQLLAEALRTASTFHDLVKSLDSNAKSLNREVAVSSQNASSQNLDRTAAIIGAAAGAGAALGELHGGQKGVMIGIAAGVAGGIVVDQIVRHQEAAKAQAAADSQ